jgi:hypothetical protein
MACAGVSIENSWLAVEVDPDGGRATINSKRFPTPFVVVARFARKTRTAKSGPVGDPVWGQGTEIAVDHADGSRTTLRLFADEPFVHVHTAVHNPGKGPVASASLEILDMNVRLGDQSLASYGTGGLAEPGESPGSYSFHAYVNGETRNGLVTAWLTHERGVGVLFPGPADTEASSPTYPLRARIDFGRFQANPGETRNTDTLLIGFFDDARLGLEAYADAVSRQYHVTLRRRPNVYCTWYHAGASSEQQIARNTEFAAEHLLPYGLNVMQIDDKWQAPLPKGFQHEGKIRTTGPVKVFVDTQPNYPRGMAHTARKITSHGMVAGIWFMPFAGNFRNPYFDPDIFAQNPDSTPFHDQRWSGTCLDMSDPKTQAFLHQRVKRIYDWGYRYFKIDGMHTGMPSNNIYVHTGYREQDFGKSLLDDPHTTHIEAYRKGLNILRDAAPDVFVLGCNVSQNMMCMGPAFGLIDGMRIGPDNGGAGRGDWKAVTRGAWHGTNLYFLNRRVWYNDPDPVYVRPSNPIDSARWMCSWLAVAGGMHTSSEGYGDLPPDRLDLLRRCLPGHDLDARPVDLLESNQPRIWLARDERLAVIGLFNWNPSDREEIVYDLGKLGLDASATYACFDYWENRFADPIQGTLEQTLPGGTSRVLAVRPQVDHPQLLSTSRHITQGLIDVEQEAWDGAASTLRGRSQVVGNDPYELRIALPPGGSWKAVGVSSDVGRIRISEQTDRCVRVVIDAAESGELSWSVEFEK